MSTRRTTTSRRGSRTRPRRNSRLTAGDGVRVFGGGFLVLLAIFGAITICGIGFVWLLVLGTAQ